MRCDGQLARDALDGRFLFSLEQAFPTPGREFKVMPFVEPGRVPNFGGMGFEPLVHEIPNRDPPRRRPIGFKTVTPRHDSSPLAPASIATGGLRGNVRSSRESR